MTIWLNKMTIIFVSIPLSFQFYQWMELIFLCCSISINAQETSSFIDNKWFKWKNGSYASLCEVK